MPFEEMFSSFLNRKMLPTLMNRMKILNNLFILQNKRICVRSQSARVNQFSPTSDFTSWTLIQVLKCSAIELDQPAGLFYSLGLLHHFLAAAQRQHESLARVQKGVKRDLCLCPVESLSSTIKFASRCNLTACAIVTDSTVAIRG